jgi:hypothetical protein
MPHRHPPGEGAGDEGDRADAADAAEIAEAERGRPERHRIAERDEGGGDGPGKTGGERQRQRPGGGKDEQGCQHARGSREGGDPPALSRRVRGPADQRAGEEAGELLRRQGNRNLSGIKSS